MAIERRKEWLHLHFHQNLCWQLIHSGPTIWLGGGRGVGRTIRNSRQRPSEHCGMHLCFSAPVPTPSPPPPPLLMALPSSISKCQVHIGSEASFKCAAMIAHIHTAARYMWRGLEMGALQGVHWDTLIAIIIIIIITGCHHQPRGIEK